jgi:protein phosphatase
VQDEDILREVGMRHAQAACDAMLAMALDRGGLDNVTVIVVRLQPQVRRSSEPTRSPLDGEPQP